MGASDATAALGALRKQTALIAAIAAGAGLGAAVALYAADHGKVPTETVKVGTASAAAVLAVITAHLLLVRMRRTRSLVDVLLTATVTLRALACVVMVVATSAGLATGSVSLYAVVAVGAGISVSLGFAIAAFIPAERLADPERTAEMLFGWGALLTAVTVGSIGITIATVGESAHEAALIMGNLIAAALALVAVIGFARRADHGESRIFVWLAVASAVTASAQLADVVVPWSRLEDLSAGDIIALTGWLGLVFAGVMDMQAAHARQTVDAVAGERRRLARELHDGLAQELAYISCETRRHEETRHLADLAEAALEDSRAAIAALTRPSDEPLERSIADAAVSIAARGGAEATVAVRPGLDISPEARIALLRVLREAINNAIRHGRARTIRVSVDGPSPLVMSIGDDGDGFDVNTFRRPDALGLVSMRERVENLGGTMEIDSAPGQGTRVAVVLP